MKSYIKTIFRYASKAIAFIFHCICNYKVCSFIKRIDANIYSQWIGFEFKKIGKQTRIGRGLYLKGGKYIEIGKNSQIGKGVYLTAWDRYLDERFIPKIIIGNNSSIGNYGHVTAISTIIVGNNVRMGKMVFITDNSHGKSERQLMDIAPNYRPLYSKGAVVIEDNVWIGDKTTILPGVTIGKGAIIGANSVVTKDIPTYCVVGGNPARIIKHII